MHTNLDHDVLRKKTESRRLDIQDRWFLRKQKKQCPDQLPAGYSALNDKSKQPEWTSSQHAMRQTMTSSVSKKRPVLKTIEKPLTAEQQRLIPFAARISSLAIVLFIAVELIN